MKTDKLKPFTTEARPLDSARGALSLSNGRSTRRKNSRNSFRISPISLARDLSTGEVLG